MQQVTGTGPEGRVRAQDVEQFVPPAPGMAPPMGAPAMAAPTPAAPPPPGAVYTDIPLSNIRQVTILTLCTTCNWSDNFE